MNTILGSDSFSILPATDGLSRLAVSAEQSFLSVGGRLEEAMHEIGKLKELFAEIEIGLGADSADQLSSKIELLAAKADQVREVLAEFVERTTELEAATSKVSLQITDLDRVVRTIATLAITARVIGHALSPPEPKVVAFVENLSQMSLDADEILSDVTAAMAQIRVEMQDLPDAVEKISRLLNGEVLRQLSGLTASAEAVQARRPALVAAGAELRADMSRVSSDIGRVIVAMQVGDAFRQRLGRIVATIDQTPLLCSPSAIGISHRLSSALLDGAYTETKDEIGAAVTAMSAIENASSDAVKIARSAYLRVGAETSASKGLTDGARLLDIKLTEVESQLSSLRERTDRVVARVKEMFSRERTLRQIAHKVRLSGLNAIIICTQLGSRANALREVAQWLRTMTDEADDATTGLQSDLNKMRDLIERVAVDGLGKLSDGSGQIVQGGHDLLADIKVVNDLVDMASSRITSIGHALPNYLTSAKAGLVGFLGTLDQLLLIESNLRRLSAGLPCADLPFDIDSLEDRHFAQLRCGYTMAREREIHDSVLKLGEERVPSSLPPSKATADSSDEDLDDILF